MHFTLKTRRLTILAFMFVSSGAVCATESVQGVEMLKLENQRIFIELTPDIGGRVLTFARQGKENFLKVGAAVQQTPNPTVDAMADNIGYLGHEMWVGPQSAWWTQQVVNKARLAEKAVWPPDPYLVLSKYRIVSQTAQQLTLQSPFSLVSGVQLTKTYRLLEDDLDSVQLDVVAHNLRKESVSWDIWFNTRVHPETQVYVPVIVESDVRIKTFPGDVVAPPVHRFVQGLFTFDLLAPPPGKSVRRGKAFIQPASGWLAGFSRDQLFIIQFEWQPLERIHPEQGQVELYLDYQPALPEAGLLEMEVHAPYKKLAPGERMRAQELWTIVPYSGEFTDAARIPFLRQQIKLMGLPDF